MSSIARIIVMFGAVWSALGGAAEGNATARVLIVTGEDYPGHKWAATAPALAEVLGKDPRIQVRVVEDPHFLDSSEVGRYDVLVLHFMNWERPAPGAKARANLRRFVQQGKGLFVVHFASGAFQDWPEFANLAGRVWDPNKRGHDPHGTFRVDITDLDHPITRGMQSFGTTDELYTCLAGDRAVDVLATARSKVDGKDYPMAFAFNYGRGRVFHSPLGHDVEAIKNPMVGVLFRRGCAWVARLQPVAVATCKKPKKVVLIAGRDSHTVGAHKHEQGVLLLKECLDSSANVKGLKTEVVFERLWPNDLSILDDADAILIYSDGWKHHPLAQAERLQKIRELTARGVGLLCIHYAVAPPQGSESQFMKWIGGYYDMGGYSQNPVSNCQVSPGSAEHPICRGWRAFRAYDEFYYRIRFGQDDARLVPVMTAMLPGRQPQREILAWAVEREDGGRGFGFTGGHFQKNWGMDPFRKMILNAILWTAKVEVPEDGVQSTVKPKVRTDKLKAKGEQ
ncbi:MAG: ThuA domain-containing protein [Planctomycetota bacterium]